MKKAIFLRNLLIATGIVIGSLAWVKPLPKVFLAGDSISIHYGPHLKQFVNAVIDLEQKQIEKIERKQFSRNGGDTRQMLAYLTVKTKQADFKPAYLMLNCGLHDIGRDTLTNALQVPADEYRKNLESIFKLVQDKGIAIVWISTTPVIDSIHNARTKKKLRYAADVDAYNKIAADVCGRYGVKIIDLYTFTSTLGAGVYLDNVHYNDSTRVLQAAYIAGALSAIINDNLSAK